MRKIIYIFLLIFCVGNINAQPTIQQQFENLQKYWYYRFRLKNDFVYVGEGQGMSIPAPPRTREVALRARVEGKLSLQKIKEKR